MVIRTPEDWHLAIVPIERSKDSGFVATGFLMNFYSMPCLVTNKHVALENERLQFRLNMYDKRIERIKIGNEKGFEDDFEWVQHPDEKVDLAAILVPWVLGANVIGLNFDTIANTEELYDGREIFYWGFPLGYGAEKKLQHLPIMRTGIVAQIRGKKQFMIEANVFPGSSGSPIFSKSIVIKEDLNKDGNIDDSGIIASLIFKAPKLLGIVSSYIPYEETAYSRQTGIPRITFQENSGLANAINSHCIFDIIDTERFKKQAKLLMEEHDLETITEPRARAYDFDPRN